MALSDYQAFERAFLEPVLRMHNRSEFTPEFTGPIAQRETTMRF